MCLKCVLEPQEPIKKFSRVIFFFYSVGPSVGHTFAMGWVKTSAPFGHVKSREIMAVFIFAQGLQKTHMNWLKGVRNSLGVRNMPLLIFCFFFLPRDLKKLT